MNRFPIGERVVFRKFYPESLSKDVDNYPVWGKAYIVKNYNEFGTVFVHGIGWTGWSEEDLAFADPKKEEALGSKYDKNKADEKELYALEREFRMEVFNANLELKRIYEKKVRDLRVKQKLSEIHPAKKYPADYSRFAFKTSHSVSPTEHSVESLKDYTYEGKASFSSVALASMQESMERNLKTLWNPTLFEEPTKSLPKFDFYPKELAKKDMETMLHEVGNKYIHREGDVYQIFREDIGSYKLTCITPTSRNYNRAYSEQIHDTPAKSFGMGMSYFKPF